MTNLTYKDENNNDVLTSQFLKNKKTCCKTKCLHCPYGYTLETLGLEFIPVTVESMARANEIISPKKEDEGLSLASSMLASAYGSPKKAVLITPRTLDKFLIIKLKERECGVVKKGIVQLSKIYLKEHFTDQGLELHIVDDLYNESLKGK